MFSETPEKYSVSRPSADSAGSTVYRPRSLQPIVPLLLKLKQITSAGNQIDRIPINVKHFKLA